MRQLQNNKNRCKVTKKEATQLHEYKATAETVTKK